MPLTHARTYWHVDSRRGRKQANTSVETCICSRYSSVLTAADDYSGVLKTGLCVTTAQQGDRPAHHDTGHIPLLKIFPLFPVFAPFISLPKVMGVPLFVDICICLMAMAQLLPVRPHAVCMFNDSTAASTQGLQSVQTMLHTTSILALTGNNVNSACVLVSDCCSHCQVEERLELGF